MVSGPVSIYLVAACVICLGVDIPICDVLACPSVVYPSVVYPSAICSHACVRTEITDLIIAHLPQSLMLQMRCAKCSLRTPCPLQPVLLMPLMLATRSVCGMGCLCKRGGLR